MRAAAGPVREFSSVITSAQSKVAGLFAVAGGAAAVFGAGHMVKNAYQSIDAIAKLSDRTQTSTEDLAALKLGADLAGVGFDEMTSAAGKLQKNLGAPTKDVQDALSDLGLGVQDLLGKGALQQMEIIGDKIRSVAGAEKQAAIAMALFGKSGADLIPLLQGGSAGLKDAADQATRLGLSFSRVDAAKVEAANDAVTRLKGAFQGIADQLAITSAPFLEAIADRITDIIVKFGGAGKVVASIFDTIATAIHGVGKAVSFLENAFTRLQIVGAYIGKKFAELNVWAHRNDGPDSGTRQDAESELFGYNQRLSGLMGQNVQEQMSGGAGEKINQAIDNFAAEIQASAQQRAQERADQIEHEHQRQLAESASMRMQEEYKQKAIDDYAEAQSSKFISGLLDNLNNNDYLNGTARGPNSPIQRAADQGTRGTYAGETASRLVGAHSIAEKQLKATQDSLKELEQLNKNFEDGVPVG